MSVGEFADDRDFASIPNNRVCYLPGLSQCRSHYSDRTRKKPLLRQLKNIGMALKRLYRNTLKCNRCNLQYIGETKRLPQGRVNEHRRPVNKTKIKSNATSVSEYFLSLSVYSYTDMRLIPLEKVYSLCDSVRNCNLHRFSILLLCCMSFPPLPFKRVLVRHSPSISW